MKVSRPVSLATMLSVGAFVCTWAWEIHAEPQSQSQAQPTTLDRFRQPERVVAALDLRRGQRVADVGAGNGYFTFRLAEAVGVTGRVVATDIDDRALEALRAHRPALKQVVIRKVTPDDPGLERATYDLIFLSQVDHYLGDRAQYLERLRAALAPKGRIAVTNRLGFRDPLLSAAQQAGLRVVRDVEGLSAHFLVLLEPN